MKHKSQKKGFGLLEVLLAGVIIIMMMSALVIVARAAIQNSIYLQQRSQATFLSQQSMEIVRQIRDSNYIDGKSDSKWNTLEYDSSSKKWKEVSDGQQYQTKYDNIGTVTEDYRWYLGRVGALAEEVNIDNTKFITKIAFTKINPNAVSGLLTQPPINNIASDGVAYLCTVTTTWSGVNGRSGSIDIKELVANSRQGF